MRPLSISRISELLRKNINKSIMLRQDPTFCKRKHSIITKTLASLNQIRVSPLAESINQVHIEKRFRYQLLVNKRENFIKIQKITLLKEPHKLVFKTTAPEKPGHKESVIPPPKHNKKSNFSFFRR